MMNRSNGSDALRSDARSGDARVNGRGLRGVPTDDRKLVTEFLRSRDDKAFRALYRRHAPALNQFVLRVVGGSGVDAEDAVQVTWVRAIERMNSFRWESSLRCWLTGIALNCCRELLRKRKGRDTEVREISGTVESARPSEGIGRLDLEKAIADLPNGYREILILHDIQGYTHVEIGSILGIESGTSKSQLARARKAVRAKLAAPGGSRQ